MPVLPLAASVRGFADATGWPVGVVRRNPFWLGLMSGGRALQVLLVSSSG